MLVAHSTNRRPKPTSPDVEGVLRGVFSDLVRSVDAGGAVVTVLTTLKPGQAVAGGESVVPMAWLPVRYTLGDGG